MYANHIYARFKLSYDTPRNGRITIRGIARSVVDEIIAVQTPLGATNFEITQQ